MGQTASFKPKITKIGPPVWPVEVSKKIIGKEREGKERHTKKVTRVLYFTHAWGLNPWG